MNIDELLQAARKPWPQTTDGEMRLVAQALADEVERLQRGDFTAEELLTIAAKPRVQTACVDKWMADQGFERGWVLSQAYGDTIRVVQKTCHADVHDEWPKG